jgi:rubrerythrin
MGTVFYINEIATFAIEREQESYDLYKELAEKVEKQELKEVFQTLMEEEQKHKVFYSELLSAVEDKRIPGVGAPEGEEYDAYMRALIDDRRTVKTPPVDMGNIQEVLDFAIAREKDAVLFYVGLENYVPEKDRPTVKTIIKEEGTHIVKLTELKKKFS